ncbi:MAG TPA: hypothetical protein PK691_06315 [Thermomicrobiales bacterium]|nr:hypothetical protein [Thermomicrobiales bacterium]
MIARSRFRISEGLEGRLVGVASGGGFATAAGQMRQSTRVAWMVRLIFKDVRYYQNAAFHR